MSAEPYFNSQNDLRMFGRRLQEKDDQLHQEREAREHLERACQSQRQFREELRQEIKQERERAERAEQERDCFRRDFEIAESQRLCNGYELARMKIATNAIASELEEAERERNELRKALLSATTSLEAIGDMAGVGDGLDCFDQVRAYALNRSMVARRALGGE